MERAVYPRGALWGNAVFQQRDNRQWFARNQRCSEVDSLVLCLLDSQFGSSHRTGIDKFEVHDILFLVTHGCGGSSCYFQGTRLFTPATQVVPEQIVDATGAGDVFAGAFLSQLQDLPFEKNLTTKKILATMEYASTAASKIIQVPLCRTRFLTQGN